MTALRLAPAERIERFLDAAAPARHPAAGKGREMKAIVKIPYVAWRDGRPRFVPGPELRALDFKGEDLRHGPRGDWFTLREAEDWASVKAGEIAARRKLKASRKKLRPLASARGVYSLEDLFEDLFASPKFRIKAAKTQADYRHKAKAFQQHDPELWAAPACELTRPAVIGLHEELWEQRGHAMANGMIAVMRLAFSHALDRARGSVKQNPCAKLRLKTPPPRLRVGSPAEITALIAEADDMEPSIADAIILALFTGQRQGDVLALSEERIAAGRIDFRQAKTKACVSIRAIPMLTRRLETIRERKRRVGQKAPGIVLDPRSGKEWNCFSFRHRFAEVRSAAAEKCPSLADFKFLDLRDTAVTWLHRAGCNAQEIRSVTGHSDDTVNSILKHYLAIDNDTNDRAMANLDAWLEKTGVKL
jgi:integrase